MTPDWTAVQWLAAIIPTLWLLHGVVRTIHSMITDRGPLSWGAK